MSEAPDYICFVSYGNDSIALLQWAIDNLISKGSSVVAAHSDTGWAAEWWQNRVSEAQRWAASEGIHCATIPSMGMVELVKSRKAWPRQGMQFCTTELKIGPAKKWMDVIDPGLESVCMVGVRRAESRSRRQWQVWVEESENHGGRSLWSPLATFCDRQRDELIAKSPFGILPHRSMECYPCINSNRSDLRNLTEDRIKEIEEFEKSLGTTSKGKPRTMFRPYRHMGAIGIREVYRWAMSKRGQYEQDIGPGSGCDSGMCGN